MQLLLVLSLLLSSITPALAASAPAVSGSAPRAASEIAAPAQEIAAIDPGPWNQFQPAGQFHRPGRHAAGHHRPGDRYRCLREQPRYH